MSSTPSSAENSEPKGKTERTVHLEESHEPEKSQHGHISKALILTVLWTACSAFAFGFSYVTGPREIR